MKKLYILLTLLVLSVSAFAQNGRSLYNKYSDNENVEAVYISPAMFRLIGKLPNIDMEGESLNLAPIIRRLSGLYILSISNSNLAAELAEDVKRFINKGDYELLMEAKDNGELTRMYVVGTNTMINGLVMFSHEPDETTFICIDGDIPRDQLENLIAETVKD